MKQRLLTEGMGSTEIRNPRNSVTNTSVIICNICVSCPRYNDIHFVKMVKWRLRMNQGNSELSVEGWKVIDNKKG